MILFLTLLLATCHCTIKITQPSQNPFPKGQLKYSIANFGDIPYGKTLKGQLVLYSQNDLCSAPEPLTHSNAIIVTSRGNCSFVTKAENAQNIGAKMVIIADNINETNKIIMADDGRGRLIHIPSLFINFEDGQKLQSLIEKSSPVDIVMKLEVNRTDIAEVHFWLSASSRQTYILMRQFQPYYEQLKGYVKLNVSYYSVECQGCPVEDCFEGDTKYCQMDGIYRQSAKGNKIIEQQFRQYALFKSSPQKWFQYLDMFDKRCSSWDYAQNCSAAILSELGTTLAFQSNKSDVLSAWSTEMVKARIYNVPDATVNGQPYRGTVDADDLAEMVCASLKKRPDGCSTFFAVTAPKQSSLTVALAVLTTLFMVLVIGGIILMIYRRNVKREITNEMSTRVTEMVTRYATLVSEQQRKGKQRQIQKSREDL